MTATVHTAPARNPLVLPAAATLVGSYATLALGHLADGTPGAQHSVTELLVMCAVATVTTVVVFGLVLPRAMRRPSADRTALTLAVLAALLVVPLFWSGLVLPLAVGGLVLGRHGRAYGGKVGIAAIVVGALTCFAYVAIYVGDWMSTNQVL